MRKGPGTDKQIFVATDGGERLDTFLQAQARLHSRQAALKLIQGKKVLVNGLAKRPGYSLKPGDRLELTISPAENTPLKAEDIPLAIVYRDERLMVIDKPAGMVVHPGAGHQQGTLANALAGELGSKLGGDRPGIVHRLDKDTSGLLVVARDSEAIHFLQKAISERVVSRRYLALVHGQLKGAGIIDAPHGRDSRHRQRFSVKPVGGRPAQTKFRVRYEFKVVLILKQGRNGFPQTHAHISTI
jgi:23S rRNA pseudouridine1911/1915/1917 synthase